MRYLDINGKKAAVIAFGSSDFGGACPQGKAFDLMDAYASFGGNYLDTAHVYGDFATPKNGESEKVIGAWLSGKKRDDYFISTKGAHHVLGTEPRYGRLSREELRRDSSESLEALKIDCIDIYWLHRDNPEFEVGEVMENMQELIENGVTKLIGASNWSDSRITEANEYAEKHGLTPFYGNQPQFSLAIQGKPDDYSLTSADSATVAMHKKTGMLMTPYSSQAKGFFTKLDTLGPEGLSEKARRRFYKPENIEIYERLKKTSALTGVSVGALALAWLTSQPFPLIPIVGASRSEQLDTAKEACDVILTQEQIDFIRPL